MSEACSNGRMRFAGSAALSAVVLGASLLTTWLCEAAETGGPNTTDGATPRRASPPSTQASGSGESAEISTSASPTVLESRPSATPSEGYTWRSAKLTHKQQRHRARLDPKRPLVQAPSFQIRGDGTSVVSLAISRPVSVVESRAGRRIEYRLDTAQVGVENNLNPLITGHFPTPLLRVVLRRDKGGVILVLHLRETTEAAHVVRAGPAGAVLEVTLPKPTRSFPPPTSAEASTREQKPLDRARPASTGLGPRL
jgi:hypothetical protein